MKVVELPPGPPVLSPLVAEVYGPGDAERQAVARAVKKVFDSSTHIVDTDISLLADAPIRVRDTENVGTSFPGFVDIARATATICCSPPER